MRGPWPALGRSATVKRKKNNNLRGLYHADFHRHVTQFFTIWTREFPYVSTLSVHCTLQSITNVQESHTDCKKHAAELVTGHEYRHGLINPLHRELNPICYLLALLAHHFLHVSRIRVKPLTFRLLMSYIYIWSTYSWCSRSHTTTHHSR